MRAPRGTPRRPQRRHHIRALPRPIRAQATYRASSRRPAAKEAPPQGTGEASTWSAPDSGARHAYLTESWNALGRAPTHLHWETYARDRVLAPPCRIIHMR